jgi:hypothetical protein
MDYAAPTLQEAPGAKAARVCGILAIILSLTCIGILFGIILGIVAIVQHAKAKRLARQYPEAYLSPSASGLVLGIIGLVMPVIMLPFLGIVSAIAIPAFLGQRGRARDKVVLFTMNAKLPELAERYGRSQETGANAMTIKGDLDAYLQSSVGMQKNPYNPQAPAFRYTVGMTTAATEEEMTDAATQQASILGEVVFVMSAPIDPQAPRYVAGAVRTQTPMNGNSVSCKVIRVD